MVFRRGGFNLTPPSTVLFVISVVLAVAALLVRYAGVAIPLALVSPARVFDLLAVAYAVLAAGVVFRGL